MQQKIMGVAVASAGPYANHLHLTLDRYSSNYASTAPLSFTGHRCPSSCCPTNSVKAHTHTHTQPFYSSLHFVRDNPGELVPEGTFRNLLDFLVQNEDNRGRHTNNRDGLPVCHPIQTNWCPHLCHRPIFTLDALPGTTLSI